MSLISVEFVFITIVKVTAAELLKFLAVDILLAEDIVPDFECDACLSTNRNAMY